MIVLSQIMTNIAPDKYVKTYDHMDDGGSKTMNGTGC